MNFVTFSNNRYQEVAFEESKINQNYYQADYEATKLNAHINALKQMLQIYRTVYKYMLFPKIMLDFILVGLKLRKDPVPVLVNQIKKQKEEQEQAKKVAEEMLNVTPIKSEQEK